MIKVLRWILLVWSIIAIPYTDWSDSTAFYSLLYLGLIIGLIVGGIAVFVLASKYQVAVDTSESNASKSNASNGRGRDLSKQGPGNLTCIKLWQSLIDALNTWNNSECSKNPGGTKCDIAWEKVTKRVGEVSNSLKSNGCDGSMQEAK